MRPRFFAIATCILAALFVATGALAYSPNQVILLTSIAPQTDWAIEPDLIARQERKLSRIFQKRWEDYPVTVHIAHRVDATQLYQVLQGPGVRAVFYVGHAGSNRTESVITDFKNRNVRRLFDKTHPDLEFLGLVGCSVERPLNTNIRLKIHSVPGVQEAAEGLEKAIVAAKNAINWNLEPPPASDCESVTGVPLTLTRKLGADQLKLGILEFPPLQISAADQEGVLAVAPKVDHWLTEQTGVWTQTYSFMLPLKEGAALPLLRIESGAGATNEKKARAELGTLTIEVSGLDGGFRAISHRDGRPIGVSSQIFKYSGSSARRNQLRTYSPHRCESAITP